MFEVASVLKSNTDANACAIARRGFSRQNARRRSIAARMQRMKAETGAGKPLGMLD